MIEYRIFDPKVRGPLHEATRDQAEQSFTWFMEQRESRIAELTRIVGADGIDLTWDEAGLEKLNDWLWWVIESCIADNQEMPGVVFSIVNDISMFVGELLVRKKPHLYWKLNLDDEQGLSYQRPVISGFQNVSNRNYYFDPDYVFVAYALRIFSRKEREKKYIVIMYKKNLSYA